MTHIEDFAKELGAFIDALVGRYVAEQKCSKWEHYTLADPPGGQGLLYFAEDSLYLKITITEEVVP